MGEANAGTLAKGLTLRLPAAIIPSVQEADDAFGRIAVDAITRREAANCLEAEAWAWAGSPMAEDPAPTEPAHHTPVASESSQATTWSKMEVALPRGKVKKVSDRESADPCAKCVGSTVPCHGFPGCTCQKCAGLKVKCVHSRGRVAGVAEAAEASASQAGPSVQPQPSAGSDKEEEAVIMVRAGKGKAVSAQAKGVTVDEGDFEEIMQ
ncbi:hypothetical protein PAXRUDRAFT_177317 [Paxillus rubicundulus Ve08.2h10]|uniref:Zn(2)-C6 fungal-type domain-containing protein n=1 Tax=Paxillus rubicundulus Ve08.2h10 TaxID=930991 RepID=A0A0D0CSH6_9AGAM|nr:hypothetical protein PAXRUDRAFT_177317 [Paxillus rubicundulus Ve08.2h10]